MSLGDVGIRVVSHKKLSPPSQSLYFRQESVFIIAQNFGDLHPDQLVGCEVCWLTDVASIFVFSGALVGAWYGRSQSSFSEFFVVLFYCLRRTNSPLILSA